MKAKWTFTKDKRKLKKIYLSIIPTISRIARDSGYAIGVHGSLERDLDLIAVPWVRKCVKPATLATRIFKNVSEYTFHTKHIFKNVTDKPHGRKAYSVYIGRHAYIDLSIFQGVEKVK